MRVAHDSVPAWIDPMPAKPDGGRLREGPQWAYKYKLDGYRVAMRIAAGGTTMLTSRWPRPRRRVDRHAHRGAAMARHGARR
jgi:YD repeat-containing protein